MVRNVLDFSQLDLSGKQRACNVPTLELLEVPENERKKQGAIEKSGGKEKDRVQSFSSLHFMPSCIIMEWKDGRKRLIV